MKKNVLVFPCGSEIGLEIHRSLSLSTHFELFGGSSVDDHGAFVYQNYRGGLPLVDAVDFIDAINQLVAVHQIDFIIPAHDDVIVRLAQAKAAGTLKCELITAPLATCELARSKRKTYQMLQDVVPVPKLYEVAAIKADDFPVFLKPDAGQGSRGTHRAESRQDVDFYLAKDPTLLVLEYLPGEEYTVDCFTDRHGKLRISEGRVRQRIAGGISVNSRGVQDERFGQLAEWINQALEFRGVWFFQVKQNAAGELVLLEFAPRVAGTMGLIRARGLNLVLLSLFDAMEYDIDSSPNDYQPVIDRALQNSYRLDIDYQHVYLDLDDLVIFEGRVNPAVMAFVYQCRNKGVAIHLLTRHRADLDATLAQYRLTGIFDERILVKDGEHKHAYIRETSAIFIDDSFAERQAVHQAHGIPVFDAHMLESLMEKF